MLIRALVVVGLIVAAAPFLGGLPYYVTPRPERPFSPLHELYAPTGLIGQGLGVVGTAMIVVGVALYSLRKRVPALTRVGTLKSWLHLHIFLCLLGPFLVLLHTTFKFGGLVAISFWSMALVVGSGVFGRWVYVWIPKTVNGRFLGIQEVREQIHALAEEVAAQIQVPTHEVQQILQTDRPSAAGSELGIMEAIGDSIRFRLRQAGERTALGKRLSERGIREPARSRIIDQLHDERRLQHQVHLIRPFQRAFRYWHAFHLPLAIVMLLILVVHVAVSIAFGYTWIF